MIEFTVSVENQIPQPAIFDVWSMVTLPNGSQFGPVMLRQGATISGSSIVRRQLRQVVPGNAPAGNYIYTGYVGNYPDVIIASDAFPFIKMPSD